jgi:hypothetical protein
MRFVIFNTAMAFCLALLAGCTSTPPATEKTHVASLVHECSELEGYPDCQDSQQVDLTAPYQL